ncbi:MAG: hypothetical protein WCJ56_00190 [bacterium]
MGIGGFFSSIFGGGEYSELLDIPELEWEIILNEGARNPEYLTLKSRTRDNKEIQLMKMLAVDTDIYENKTQSAFYRLIINNQLVGDDKNEAIARRLYDQLVKKIETRIALHVGQEVEKAEKDAAEKAAAEQAVAEKQDKQHLF